MSTSPSNRRRKLIVDPAVQSRIVMNIAWPPALTLAVSSLLLGLLSTKLLDEALIARIELPSLIPVLVTVIVFLIASVGFLVFQALKVSNRIAGPIYRLQKTLDSAKAGDYTARAKLREDDYLAQVAGTLNEFLGQLAGEPADGDVDETPGPQGLGEPPGESVEETEPTTTDPTAN